MIFKKFVKFYKRHFFIILLFIFELVLFLTNYKSGTWLAGWDNYLPSLNFKANFIRSFFGVWQEYRGLGLYDGMAHTANLVHTLFIWLLSWFLPTNFLRYFFHHLMHFLGGVGAYYLFQTLFRIDKKPHKRNFVIKSIGFFASLFYLLNVGTIQIFYTLLEVFSVHFCALPWLSLFLIKFLKKGKKKDLLWFFILSLLFTPQAFVPTLFIVYFLSVFILFLLNLKKFKRIILVSVIILCANAFWALPYFYGIAKNARITTSSKINQMSNENILLKNKAFGDFKSTALIHGLSLDFTDWQGSDKTGYMMKSWKEHLDKPAVKVISWGFFALTLLGVVNVMVKNPVFKRSAVPHSCGTKDKPGFKAIGFYPFLILFLISFLMLGNDIPILSIVFDSLSKYIPFFAAAFRFVFTKFSILYVLCYSLFLGLGLHLILEIISRILPKKITHYSLLITVYCLLIFYSFPSFKGNFFYHNLKINIPQEYFQLIDYFKSQNKNSRLVILPQPEFWGWTYYNWGFRGSGFIWQGLPQSNMDGAFLPWSKGNENFYWQISQAIYSQDLDLLESILEKYQINWLVLDKNITDIGAYKSLQFSETENLFSKSSKISLAKELNDIKVYEVNLKTPIKDFVFLAQDLPQINQYEWNNEDTAFSEYGYYLGSSTSEVFEDFTSEVSLPQTYYPFRSLFTGRKQEELEFEIEDKGDHFIFSNLTSEVRESRIYAGGKTSEVYIPELSKAESVFYTKDLKEEPIATPSVVPTPARNSVEVKIEKKKGYFTYDSNDDEKFFNLEPNSCNPFNTGEMDREAVEEKERGQQLLRFTSISSSNCLSVDLPYLIHETGYLVVVKARPLQGRPFSFNVINKTSQNRVIETYLPEKSTSKVRRRHNTTSEVIESYFIIPPMEKYGQGYSLNFDNISIGRQKTINDLGRVEVYPIPYRFLKQIKFYRVPQELPRLPDHSTSEVENRSNLGKNRDNFGDFQVKHPNPSFYKISINNETMKQWNNSTIVLSQSFHPGWIAFYKGNNGWKRLEDHVLVNNWQNGWKLDQLQQLQQANGVSDTTITTSTTIYLFFLPQLLEYLGFGLLAISILYLILSKPNKSK